MSIIQNYSKMNPSVIVISGNKKIYNGIAYDIRFPDEWITDYKPNTGPNECLNCALNGVWRGSFIGYCCNCAYFDYNYTRGCGMFGRGVELYWINPSMSAHNTYLHGVSLDSIGDQYADINDSIYSFENMLNVAEASYPPYQYLPDAVDEEESVGSIS